MSGWNNYFSFHNCNGCNKCNLRRKSLIILHYLYAQMWRGNLSSKNLVSSQFKILLSTFLCLETKKSIKRKFKKKRMAPPVFSANAHKHFCRSKFLLNNEMKSWRLCVVLFENSKGAVPTLSGRRWGIL